MSIRLSKTQSKNSTSFFIIEDVYDSRTRKRTTRSYKKLGSLEQIKKERNLKSDEEVKAYLNDILAREKKVYASHCTEVVLTFAADAHLPLNAPHLYDIGYLYPMKLLSTLGLREICDEIVLQRSLTFDLYSVLCDYVLVRLIYPGTIDLPSMDAQRFYGRPAAAMQEAFCSLSILSAERVRIQEGVARNLSRIVETPAGILPEISVLLTDEQVQARLARIMPHRENSVFSVNSEQIRQANQLFRWLNRLLLNILEQYLDYQYPGDEIQLALSTMRIDRLNDTCFRPVYMRTKLIDDLDRVFGYDLSTVVLRSKSIDAYVRDASDSRPSQHSLYTPKAGESLSLAV